jgi:hypothetical protein
MSMTMTMKRNGSGLAMVTPPITGPLGDDRMKSQCVADIEGAWIEQDFKSHLIESCKRYWNIPASELPNEMLAMFLRQRIALQLIIPEAQKWLDAGVDDGSEIYDGELADALANTAPKGTRTG